MKRRCCGIIHAILDDTPVRTGETGDVAGTDRAILIGDCATVAFCRIVAARVALDGTEFFRVAPHIDFDDDTDVANTALAV